MEGDLYHQIKNHADCISTHALTWRATDCKPQRFLKLGISTHALTWRATGSSYLTIDSLVDFYPRPHMEGDFS